MPAVFNPTIATVIAPHVVRDGVTAFRLRAQRVGSVAAIVDEPVPTVNPDGTYTVSLTSLEAAITADFYGDSLDLYVQCVAPSGVSTASIDPNGFVYQPVPAAPTSVAVS